MKLHLVDGTFELFRGYYGAPEARSPSGREVGATRAYMRSLAALLREPDVTHVACAFDHVVESFRNELFVGYKTGEGIEPELFQQFELVERATRALGVTAWPMVEFEADDALAAGAAKFVDEVEQVILCSPDKDLAQCVVGTRVVCFDRIRRRLLDEEGVHTKFGVAPSAIPDYLGLVGDAADGIPGIPRWGAKSAATVLAHYGQLEAIPDDASAWAVKVRGAAALAENLASRREEAALYKKLATLRTDVPLQEGLDDLRVRGPAPDLAEFCQEIGERPDRFQD
jgi:5'-3' exonuclease